MKTFIALALLALAALPATAQQETLLQGEIEHGGFGGPAIQFTVINKEFGVLVGGGGAWIIDHSFMLGGFGYGLVNNVTARKVRLDSVIHLDMGYGAVYLGYALAPNQLVHLTTGVMIGAGSINFRDIGNETENGSTRFDHNDNFFLVEPMLGVELNVATNFHLALNGSYRIVSGIETEGLDNGKIGGPSLGLVLKFGSL